MKPETSTKVDKKQYARGVIALRKILEDKCNVSGQFVAIRSYSNAFTIYNKNTRRTIATRNQTRPRYQPTNGSGSRNCTVRIQCNSWYANAIKEYYEGQGLATTLLDSHLIGSIVNNRKIFSRVERWNNANKR